jgi:hypothetical protein
MPEGRIIFIKNTYTIQGKSYIIHWLKWAMKNKKSPAETHRLQSTVAATNQKYISRFIFYGEINIS